MFFFVENDYLIYYVTTIFEFLISATFVTKIARFFNLCTLKLLKSWTNYHGVQRRMISVDNFFCIFEIIIFCFVVAICDGLVHDVETIFHLSYLLTASGNLF